MRAHEGLWRGVYQHLDADGVLEDVHDSEVLCEFPTDGPVFYRQRIRFRWADGRTREDVFDGVIRDGAVWFDTPTFHGKSWESEGLVLLTLQRKDEPGALFHELIALGAGGDHRARTWHWFRDGRLYRRTLCTEQRVGGPAPDHRVRFSSIS